MANIQIIKINTSWLFPTEYICVMAFSFTIGVAKSLIPIILHRRIALQMQNSVRSSRGLIQYLNTKCELTAVFVGEIKTQRSVLVPDFQVQPSKCKYLLYGKS
jgi:hypothetical protein